MKVVLITNIPAPYRLPIFERIWSEFGDRFLVIYAADREKNRSWNLPEIKFNHIFLKKRVTAKKDGFNFVHNNLDVWSRLKEFNPDVVVTTGFNPTHIYAYVFARMYNKKHIPMTDGWLFTEKDLSIFHKLLRKLIFSTSHAFIGASEASLLLYNSYGIESEKLFKSHLCVENKRFYNTIEFENREYDLMFSGQFTDRKMPLFFSEIAGKVSKEFPKLKVLVLGEGPLKEEFFSKLESLNIDFHYAGFVTQEELPSFYSRSKLFLFTTKLDPWGVVVNEALASGTPVLTTPFAGVANDLIINGKNGYVLPVDSKFWSQKIISLLNNQVQWNNLSIFSKRSVREFNFDAAAKGIVEACEFAYKCS